MYSTGLRKYSFDLIRRHLTSNVVVKPPRRRRFLRTFLLTNGLIIGGSTLYYFSYLTHKEQRQVRVTFEGLRRGLRYVSIFRLFQQICLSFR